jgi:hypothetical protein
MLAVLIALLIIFDVVVAQTHNYKNNIARLDRQWKSRKANCEKEQCSALIPEEAYNCVNECVSKLCYDEIYASNPLEDGEVDNARSRSFTNCLRKEEKYMAKKKPRK